MLTGLIMGIQVAVLALAAFLDPAEAATHRIQSWILVGMCGTLVVVVGYFLKNLHQDFRALVSSVQHIERTVSEHGATLKHHHELLEKMDRNMKTE